MNMRRKLSHNRQDYSQELLDAAYKSQNISKAPKNEEMKGRNFQGGLYSDSEVGGAKQDQRNPWQGSQEEAKSERP
jgi:hypothetical protein